MAIFKLTANNTEAFIDFSKKAAKQGVEISNVDIRVFYGGNETKHIIVDFDSSCGLRELVAIAMSLTHKDIVSIEMDEQLIRTIMAFKHS